MLRIGKSLEAIAKERGLSLSTIQGHLVRLYRAGKDIDIWNYIDKATVEKIAQAKKSLNSPDKLKPYFEYFGGEIGYGEIRLGLVVLERGES